MTSRKPELLSITSYDFGLGYRRDGIFAKIVMRGIKGEPIETHELTHNQALHLMSDLALALLNSEATA